MHKHNLLMHKKWFRKSAWAFLAVFLTASVLFVQQNADFIKTSVLPSVTHDPFDGTVMPVQKVPKWSSLTEAEYKNAYNQIPSNKLMSAPEYNPSDFEVPFSSIKWGDSSKEDIRNAKITYSVPYMGDYSLDSIEYAGSHLAVDIKVPVGTPVFAIGNAKVIKISNQSDGFGHHIVLEHDNFPTFESKNKLTTYYSSYSHLDTILVSEGDIVTKGQQIALSGKTGTTTTPHIHFQIDNDEAPWHPYWPFTWQEVNDAGLNFWSAINEGLGQDKAIATTINPLMYVQKYKDASAVFTETPVENIPAEATPADNTPESTPTETENPTVDNSEVTDTYVPEETVTPDVSELNIQINLRNSYDEGDVAYATVTLLDQNSDAYEGNFDGVITISLTNEVGDMSKKLLSYNDFENGVAQVKIQDLTAGSSKVMVAYGNSNFYSNDFDVVEKEDTTEIAQSGSYSDVDSSSPNYEAIQYLSEKGVIGGYPDGTFRPEATVTRAEALKFILEGMKSPLEVDTVPFKDVPDADWSFKYVSTSVKRAIVDGYKDGTFKGGNTVNKAEFLKMLFSAMGSNISSRVEEDPFIDVGKKEWFAKYFDYAKKKNILNSDLRVWPNTGMKRGDVAEAIYRVMKMDEEGWSKFKEE